IGYAGRTSTLVFIYSSSELRLFLFFYCYGHHRDLHSFPTRRSSDLVVTTTLAMSLRGYWRTLRVRMACNPAMRMTTFTTVARTRSEEHTSELQSLRHLVCRLLLEKKKKAARLATRPMQ